MKRDDIFEQRLKYNEFYLRKWEICRYLETQRLKEEAEQKKK